MRLKKNQTLPTLMIIIGISLALIGILGFYSSSRETEKATTGRTVESINPGVPERLRYSRISLIVVGIFIGLVASKFVTRWFI